MKTEQEEFWAGEFGTEYVARNRDPALLTAKYALFSKILARTRGIESVLELGANIGLNLTALNTLLPQADLTVEIAESAARALDELPFVDGIHASVLDWEPQTTYDLVFTTGVLIHINPKALDEVYALMHSASRRYLLMAEYYNPTPVSIPYRGHENKLFKRDFAGELMDRYDDIELVDYGFVWRRDPVFPQDDITWFLMKKSR